MCLTSTNNSSQIKCLILIGISNENKNINHDISMKKWVKNK